MADRAREMHISDHWRTDRAVSMLAAALAFACAGARWSSLGAKARARWIVEAQRIIREGAA